MSKQAQLADALHGFTLALTKLGAVVNEHLIDPAIHTTNSTVEIPTVNVVTDTSEPKEQTFAASLELDGEGRPWVEGLHSENKATMSSPEVKGVKKWKFKRGTKQEAKDAYHAQYPIGNVEQTVPPVLNTPPATLPGTPPVLNTPPGTPPVVNTPPGAPPVVEGNEEVRKEILTALQKLVAFGVTWDDLKEIFVNEFNSAQNGEEISLGSLPMAKYTEAAKFCNGLVSTYENLDAIIAELYKIAGEHKALIDNGLQSFYATYQTNELSGVHYTNLMPLTENLTGMLNEWRNWAKG